jgi:hypothetical protein
MRNLSLSPHSQITHCDLKISNQRISKNLISIHISELVVAVNEVLEHHSVSSGLCQRHRDSDPTRSGSRKSSRFRTRAGFRSRKHLLLR